MNDTFSKTVTREDLLREIELYNMAIQKQDPDAKCVALDGIDMIHFLTMKRDSIFNKTPFSETYDLWINGWKLEPVNGKLIINLKALPSNTDFDDAKATTPTDIHYTVTHDVLSIEQLRKMCIRLSVLVKFNLK